MRGPQLGLALEHQHSPQTPLVTSLLTVGSYRRHTVGQLVPGTAQAIRHATMDLNVHKYVAPSLFYVVMISESMT